MEGRRYFPNWTDPPPLKFLVYLNSTGLGFFLNGAVFLNDSAVLLSDIGEGSSALYCLTDTELCCSIEAGANWGRWDFPSGTVGTDTTADIYSSNGFSSLLLNRRSSTGVPTGVYRCLIPDASNVLRTLHIGIHENIREFKSDHAFTIHDLHIS